MNDLLKISNILYADIKIRLKYATSIYFGFLIGVQAVQ